MQRPDLKYPIFTPGLPRRVAGSTDLFAVIRQNDVLLHHPFQSFAPVMDFLRGAAADPHVLAIKQTLYRTGNESPIVDALVAAAQSGKDVTVIVELRARFDEEANIELSNRLQEAGAHVMYGVVGYKTHAQDVDGRAPRSRRHCAATATSAPATITRAPRAATPTTACSPAIREIGQDVHELFLQLTSLTQTPQLTQPAAVAVRPARRDRRRRSSAKREHARAGRPARIIAKMNALVDPQVIEALYRASRAGVQIDLIVRGVCALRPGIPGVSENIRVRSIVGRFLEHSRVFYFEQRRREPSCTARAPTGWSAISSAAWRSPSRCASRRIASASCATSTPTSPTTRRRGRSAATADYTRCERGDEPARDAQGAAARALRGGQRAGRSLPERRSLAP